MNKSGYPRLEGKVAIVTGAGSGIGEAAARTFAKEGARVVLVGRREGPLRSNAEAIAKAGGEALAVAADVSLSGGVDRVVAETLDRFGQIDCVFNNAGIQGDGRPIIEMKEVSFDELIAINLKGPWLLTRAALRSMLDGGQDCPGGAIVNTSSFLSTGATAGTSVYSASKAGLDAMIRAIALEVGDKGVRINNVNPGVIDTPMLRAHGEEVIPPLAARAALGRIGTPQDVADVAVWLCTDEARFITGQSLLVDGGFTIPGPR
ncbi:NAD(P)-dependent dehydrogenase, short-chain alcohol dehydrogenase family [Aquisalimonas asiatica]|uniref:NAD(P)-dependent dehydrogenase, short-chain alcohol dehydrogenase family n=2 Tax=Aquisalimonas asiatica TaxID=406100 RepID=A0A1H8VTE0_9GAMM|nr:NAD(P)-dependent dehydrogenase, short-chain alcohol dehydrogenase family [Aquisalimonas asiatica]